MIKTADRQTVFLALINVIVLVAGALLAGANFVDSYNLQVMAAQVPELGLLALGVALAMISGNGGIDLSGIALANLAGITPFWSQAASCPRVMRRWPSLGPSPASRFAWVWPAGSSTG